MAVEIEWIDSTSPQATGNKIYRDTVPSTGEVEIADIANGVQFYSDATVAEGTDYKFEVQAHDGAGDETTQEVEGVNMDYITTAGGSVTLSIGNATNSPSLTNQISGVTLAHTCSANTKMLVVAINVLESNDPAFTGVTFNGAAMTQGLYEWNNAIDDKGMAIYYLANPDVGASHDVVINFTNGNMDIMTFSIVDIEVDSGSIGVDVTAPVNRVALGSPTVDITTVAEHTFIIETMHTSQGTDKLTVDAPSIEVVRTDIGSNFTGVSYRIVSSAGLNTMSWTDPDGDESTLSGAMSFKPE